MELQMIIISLLVVILIVQFILLFKKSATKTNLDDHALKKNFEQQAQLFNHLNKSTLENIVLHNGDIIKNINYQIAMQKQEYEIIQRNLQDILKNNDHKLTQLTEIIGNGLTKLQQDNERKLEQMRQTVDEKLNVSLERRLSESFNTINQRLQSVYEGLGEMKSLASGVGDLKKVLTNVKTRGTWGEVQLGNLLEQMLTHDQFVAQMDIKGNGERVDYAIALPGKDDRTIYLPIDAKFPMEDYQRLVDASEKADPVEIEKALKNLEKRVKEDAKSIKEKYINLPDTTDFAVMYLAIEGLYAEVLRRPGLAESLQQDYKIIVCGPTTISALLNSLQLGFKTLSIEKRSSEIYGLLGVFKQEFGKFVDLLAKTQKKLAEASNTIENAAKKSRTIQRKLKSVSSLTDTEPQENYLDFSEDDDEEVI